MANSGFLRSSAPMRPPVRSMMVAGIGAFVAITVLLYLQAASQLTWLMASFGASCLIVFALPDSPLAQPRNVIGGHGLSAATGIAMAHFVGVTPMSMALAVALAIVLMLWTRTPPSACRCQSDYRDGDGQLMVVFAFSRVVRSSGLGCGGLCNAQIKPFQLPKILVVNLQHKFVFTLRNNAQILTYSYIVNINSMSLNDSLK